MPVIKSASEIAQKWARVTPTRDADYRAGVERPLRDWATEAAAANDRYVEGVTQAATAGRYREGVVQAGTEKWKRGATQKGVARWGPGVRVAQPDYQAGFAPFRDAIERVELPPRRPTGDPANIERVAVIARTLHELKARARR